MSLERGGQALSLGLGLKREHWKVLIRVGWVLFVSAHIAWVCGWLVAFGLASPFAKAADVTEVQRTLRISAEIQVQAELRIQKSLWCKNTDQQVRNSIMNRIDELRRNLREIAKIEDGTEEPRCF